MAWWQEHGLNKKCHAKKVFQTRSKAAVGKEQFSNEIKIPRGREEIFQMKLKMPCGNRTVF
jgi:hypothetical protein